MDFDLNVPLMETDTEPSPIEVMPPNAQIPDNDSPIAMRGFVDFPPFNNVQSTNFIVPNGNNNSNNVDEVAVPDFGDASARADGVLKKDSVHKFDWKAYYDKLRASTSAEVNNPIDLTEPWSMEKVQALSSMGVDFSNISFPIVDQDHAKNGAQGSFSFQGDVVDAEFAPKKRKINDLLIEDDYPPMSDLIPRLIVQTMSDVDKIDDGYGWTKYGQKLIKGRPDNPRSYYKCKTDGCPVKKHVEREQSDLRYVITTYDGKHNHEISALTITEQNSVNPMGGGGGDGGDPPQSFLGGKYPVNENGGGFVWPNYHAQI